MDKRIRKTLVDHSENNFLINDKKHVFVAGRSCITILIDTLDIWTKTQDVGGTLDAIYMDFQKLFDSILHICLMSKLELME